MRAASLHARVDLGLRHLLDAQAEGDVLVDGEVRIERVALEHHGDVAVARGHVVDDAVADHDAALADVLETREHAQRGRLPAARRADEHHELAVLDVEAHAVDGARAIRVDLRNAVERHTGHRTPRFGPGPARAAEFLLPGSPRSETRVWASRVRRTLRGWRQHYSRTTPPADCRGCPRDAARAVSPRASASSASGRSSTAASTPSSGRSASTVDVWATIVRDGHEVLGAARALPPARRAPLARGSDAPRSRRIPIAGTARSRRTRSGAGSSASSRGSIASPRGSTSSSARSPRGQSDLASELSEGAALLGVASLTVEEGLAAKTGDRSEQTVSDGALEITADAERATFGSWYELFPRSWGGFAGVEKRLPEFAKLGFDVLYLPPVHPIGRTHRKGRNNAPTARRSDPGSPWAIGSEAGGHTALHPDLGSEAEFASLTARASELGIAIALDFAHPVLARPPLAARAPRLVPPPAGRDAQVRREPAQALPGHLQRQLRHRGLARALGCAARRRAALGRPRRHRLPRRQPAHEADRVLGVADRGRAEAAPRDGVPGRGVHAPGAHGDAREGRLQPVLHLLHVAQHEGRARSST